MSCAESEVCGDSAASAHARWPMALALLPPPPRGAVQSRLDGSGGGNNLLAISWIYSKCTIKLIHLPPPSSPLNILLFYSTGDALAENLGTLFNFTLSLPSHFLSVLPSPNLKSVHFSPSPRHCLPSGHHYLLPELLPKPSALPFSNPFSTL